MTQLIGLVGPKQSGKSTTLGFIENTNEIQIAGFLKDVCSAVFRVPRPAFDLQELKEQQLLIPSIITDDALKVIHAAYRPFINREEVEWGQHLGKVLYTPRDIAQYIGTEVLRETDPMVHLNACKGRLNPDKVNVVSDIRFANELDFFRGIGASLWYLKRKDAEEASKNATHASEKVYLLADLCDVIIENDSTLDFLSHTVNQLLKEI